MRRPSLSVIMPTYNRPALLARALRSLAQQTYGDFEVVVVNDAGLPVDDVIAEARRNLDVVLVEHRENRGRCGALNTAVEAAGGELLAFLDDDDLYYPHHLATLVSALAGRRHVAVYSHAIKVTEDEEGQVVSRQVVGDREYDPDLLQVTNFIVGMTVLVPTDEVRRAGGFDDRLRVLEDWDLWLRLSRRLHFEHVAVPTAEYRWRPGKANQTVREWFRFHEALEHVYRSHPLPPGSALHPSRRQMREGSSTRADAYSYELSVALLCSDDVEAATATLQSYVAAFGDDGSVELVMAVPDMAAWAPLLASLEGDVQAFAVGELPDAEVLPFLRSRVGGRRLAYVTAGELVDPAAAARRGARERGPLDIGRCAPSLA